MAEEKPMLSFLNKMRVLVVVMAVLMVVMIGPGGQQGFLQAGKVYGTAVSNGGRTYGTLQIEYRFAEGETPNIPQTIEQYGFTYHLVSQSDPVLESSLPQTRTYTYEIHGLLTQEQIDEAGLQGITLTPVDVLFERKVDVELSHLNTPRFRNMPTNDVDDIPLTYPCRVTSGTDPSGFETRNLERAGVTFEIAGYEAGTNGSPAPPAGYNATVVYRGLETYLAFGYYQADAVFTTKENEGDINYYVIVAYYETEAFAPPVEEFITDPAIPEAPDLEEDVPGIQPGKTFFDIFTGNVPFGNFSFDGAWSLISAGLALLGLSIAVIYAVGTIMRRRYASVLEKMTVHDEKWLAMVKQRGIILRILTVILGVITLITWLFLDDFSHGFVWININTPVIIILFIITMALCIITNLREQKIHKSETEEIDMIDNASA